MADKDEQALIDRLVSTGNYKVIKRFEPVECYHQPSDQDLKTAIFVDTETTGMDPDSDKVIELAIVPFEFDSDGNIYRVLPGYDGFQDPGMPIPDIVKQITGIDDEMVAGQSLDMARVAELLSQAVLVIAHNARFDRPFCENLHDDFKSISWACSIADIDWNAEGMEGVKLEFLAYKYGFFFEGHRATIDCQAGIEILSRKLPRSGEPVLKRLLDNARRIDVRLWAQDAPFDMKDLLKQRGYRWSPGGQGKRRAWYTDIPETELQDEMIFLNENVYPRAVGVLPTERFSAKERYSRRI